MASPITLNCNFLLSAIMDKDTRSLPNIIMPSPVHLSSSGLSWASAALPSRVSSTAADVNYSRQSLLAPRRHDLTAINHTTPPSARQTPHSIRTGSQDGEHISPTSNLSSFVEATFLYETFFVTRSRVLRLVRSQLPIASCLARLVSSPLYPETTRGSALPSVWTLTQEWSEREHEEDSVWIIFQTHEQASAVLALSDPSLAIFQPALETDLEPYHKLQRLVTAEAMCRTIIHESSPPCSPTALCSTPSSTSSSSVYTPQTPRDFQFMGKDASPPSPYMSGPFILSSNPPNPKMTFRAGDWLCALPTCGAHNFGRNMACIGCGNSRMYNGPSGAGYPHPHPPPPPHRGPHIQIPHMPHHMSPRFISPTDEHRPFPLPRQPMSRNASPSRGLHISSAPQSPIGPLKAPAPSYPLLTPSGHALSAGGRVRNISHDPLCPCIMYWPDNEPLPDRGQIRPLGSAVIQYPPIVNTGNKGAAEKQPGDWVCLTCNYLNWRRRKVCQTCYPYAEGNGDSISQAVQAERIALLTNVLNQVEPPSHLTRRASVPVQNNQVFPPQSVIHANPAVQSSVGPLGYRTAGRSRSQMDLRTQYQDSRPIYQTPVYNRRGISPHSRVPSPTSALLPSCLQEIIQSPMHSSPATSSSSADLSFEDYDLSFELADQMLRQAQGARVYSTSSPAVSGSIWKLDGEETKTLKFSGPPTQNDFVMDLAGRMAAGLSLITN